jgi:uncharacterized protein YcbX
VLIYTIQAGFVNCELIHECDKSRKLDNDIIKFVKIWRNRMHLSQINIYPIKSLKGISLTEAMIGDRGLQYDRRWMITDKSGKFFTQRELPKMATITVSIAEDGLRLSAPGAPDVTVEFKPEDGRETSVTIWNDEPQALVYRNGINDWLSRVLETECQLVHMADEHRRSVEPDRAINDDIVSFADAYPFLVISEASLEDLNSKLEEQLPMNRFRPNLVVSGATPIDEHNWRKFSVGKNIFYGVKPCKRCVMTTIDQDSGEFTGKEPLKTLATYRGVPGGVIFGENLLAENPGGVVRVGDEIRVIESK